MEVIGFGALNLDILCMVERLAKAGEHVAIRDIREFSGGSAANTISGLSRLGVKTGFIGAVGNDSEGRKILDDFSRDGVNLDGIIHLDGRTGVIIGFVDSEGERTLYPYPGVNDRIEIKHINLEYVKKTRFLHLSSFVNEKQFKAQKELVERLEEFPEIKISFSPGILYSRRGLKDLLPIIKKSLILFVNETEIEEITGEDYKEGSKTLIDSGTEIVAVTLGKDGCYLRTRNENYHIPAYPTKVIDTTGAGDAFATGFLYGIIQNKRIPYCGRLGNKIASMCIEKFGSRTGLPSKKEIFL